MARHEQLDDGVKQYPDSAGGVKAMLLADSAYTPEDFVDATYEIDQWVKGVWMVHFAKPAHDDATAVIAYLAGYPDSMGNIRTDNDFESEYDDDNGV